MKFGPTPLAEAAGTVLAHSIRWEGGFLRKGSILDAGQVSALREAGFETIMAARPEEGDILEDEAAARIAAALVPDPDGQRIEIARAATGRVNLLATSVGLLRVDGGAVAALNQIDEAITTATLPDFAPTAPRRMVATVKIMPYAVGGAAVEEAVRVLAGFPSALEVLPVSLESVELILTHREGSPKPRTGKGERTVRDRLAALGVPQVETRTVPHEIGPLAAALTAADADLILVLGDAATADRGDVAPAAILAAGGEILRFGMPVDPGNLLLLGHLGPRRVMVLPGCVRSPKLNGADWVLARIASGVEVTGADIAAMGVGGLLHEVPLRPQPRVGGARRPERVRVSALLLAAGMSRRMGDSNKLLMEAGGRPLAARAVSALAASRAEEILVVTGAEAEQVEAALAASGPPGLRFVRNPAYAEGMGASLRAGMAALSAEADAVVIALADMPGMQASQVDRLIDAYDPEAGRAICRTTGPDGTPGHPVLFGRRFFETLQGLSGDRGARDAVAENAACVVDLPVDGEALADLDTIGDWRQWRTREGGP